MINIQQLQYPVGIPLLGYLKSKMLIQIRVTVPAPAPKSVEYAFLQVMFERMKLEKEEGRGGHSGTPAAPTRVIDTVLTDSAGPVQTTSTTTSPTALRSEQDEAKSKLAKLDDRLKKLNLYSSLLNIGTLTGLTWHLVYLSQRLVASGSS